MRCPADREPMVALEYGDIEVDYCTACGGVWLDSGELEILFGDPSAYRRFMEARRPSGEVREKSRRCPRCDARMHKAAAGESGEVLYDWCPQSDGIWLDRGELRAILTAHASDEAIQRVAQVLREMFACSEEGEAWKQQP